MSSEDRMSRSVCMPGVCDSPFGAGRRFDGVSGVEQNRAALLHVGVDLVECVLRRLRRARHDRPVDQREESQFVARRIDADRIAGFKRRALRQEQCQSRSGPALTMASTSALPVTT